MLDHDGRSWRGIYAGGETAVRLRDSVRLVPRVQIHQQDPSQGQGRARRTLDRCLAQVIRRAKGDLAGNRGIVGYRMDIARIQGQISAQVAVAR